MLTRNRLLLLSFVVGFSAFAAGCGSSSENESSAQELQFAVEDSLLGEEYDVTQGGFSVRPPKTFLPVSDSLLATYRSQFEKMLSGPTKVSLQMCFLDNLGSAGMVASTIQGLTLSGDTAEIAGKYREFAYANFDSQNVRTGDYLRNGIYVKQLVMSDSAMVRFQLLCLTDSGDAVDLQYFAPARDYPNLIRSFESSIGSIKPLNTGGKKT